MGVWGTLSFFQRHGRPSCAAGTFFLGGGRLDSVEDVSDRKSDIIKRLGGEWVKTSKRLHFLLRFQLSVPRDF